MLLNEIFYKCSPHCNRCNELKDSCKIANTYFYEAPKAKKIDVFSDVFSRLKSFELERAMKVIVVYIVVGDVSDLHDTYQAHCTHHYHAIVFGVTLVFKIQ